MGNYIRKYNIPTYVSTTTYSKYDVVKVVSSDIEYYFVSKADANIDYLDDVSLSSNIFWMRFGDTSADFSDVWTPTYQSSVSMEPRVVNSVFDEGTTLIKSDGINTQLLKFQLNFENISDKEAFSLLCYCDYLGAGNCFFWRTCEPYNKQLYFGLTAAKHTYVKKNFNHVMIGIEGRPFTYVPTLIDGATCDSEENFSSYANGPIELVDAGICWMGDGTFYFGDLVQCFDSFDGYSDGTLTLVNGGSYWSGDGTFYFHDIEWCGDDMDTYSDGPIGSVNQGTSWLGDGTFYLIT